MDLRTAGARFSVLACTLASLLAASCSSTGDLAPPTLTGEWRHALDGGGGGGGDYLFFDADGTCGEGNDVTGRSHCEPCTYRYTGGSIYLTETGSVRNVPVTLTYDTLTVRGLGIDPDVVYARQSTVSAHRCP